MSSQVVKIEKLVHGGQGMAKAEDGKTLFVWNSLPYEEVEVKITKNKKSYAEATATRIIKASKFRIAPREPEAYLSTSPWQIVEYTTEANLKKEIISETFSREKIKLPEFDFYQDDNDFGYRNKMEYGFFGDERGLHLALHSRGSHQKLIVTGSALAMLPVDRAATNIAKLLEEKGIRASQLKSLIVRSTQTEEVHAALFVKEKGFIKLPEVLEFLAGFEVYYSNPKSPASVPTELIYSIGKNYMEDSLLGKPIKYSVLSFFQGNLPVFEVALSDIKDQLSGGNIIDAYSGVGSIGLSVAKTDLKLIEDDPSNLKMAKINAGKSKAVKILDLRVEQALDYIEPNSTLILDPPRAGLHPKIIDGLLKVLPSRIIYLSCNPVTQARDIALLGPGYNFSYFKGYNFFPRTPHIECLAVLNKN